MKQLLKKFIPGALLVSLLGSSALAQNRIGTVDIRKVFDGYWKTKQADAALKERATDMEKEHKNMVDDWKKAKEDYQALLADASNQALSSDERDKRKKSAEDKLKYIKDTEDTIGQYERQARTTLEEQKRRMRENILVEIRNVLNAKAKAAAYPIVVDTSADSLGGTPIVPYFDTAVGTDLTDSVLSQLNAGAPGDATTTSDPKPSDKDKKDTAKKK